MYGMWSYSRNTDETYCIVFKATEEKRQVAEKIIGHYRNNQIED